MTLNVPALEEALRRWRRQAARALGRRPSLPALAAALALSAGACTTAAPSAEASREARPLMSAAQQPLRDLSILREPTPAVLEDALRGPYAVPAGGCTAFSALSLQLDAELGPDVDAPKVKAGRVQALTAEAVKSMASLPYRSLVRRISGAAALDETRSAAILAGMVRRGYLKGLLQACSR